MNMPKRKGRCDKGLAPDDPAFARGTIKQNYASGAERAIPIWLSAA
jgi:hypothetical protein